MGRTKYILLALLVSAGIALALNFRKTSFIIGGFFAHTGYVIQDWAGHFHDKLHDEDKVHPHDVFNKIIAQNKLQANIWKLTPPVTERKPKALLIMCIDPRLDDNRILGDTRGYYDIIRIPGSVITPEVAEAVELAVVKHSVKLVLVATHTDCAMEKLAQSKAGHEHYPMLSKGINDHALRLRDLSHRPEILKRLQKQEVWVIERRIDTATGKFL